jgi:scyllo-inositol 2-dehydrogenase (NADP+)
LTRSITVGLAGFGLAGRVFHAPLISVTPGLRLTHVVERRTDESKKIYPDVTIVRDFDALLDPQGPELVVIATPNDTHATFAARALAARKHVVVDKPFASSTVEADLLIESAASGGRLLSVYQNRRWDGDFRTVRQIVNEGTLGRIVQYEAHFDRFRPTVNESSWKERRTEGSGLLYDLGSHLIDQALVLFGTPEFVTADVGIEREGSSIDDYFDVLLRYDHAGGLRVRLRASKLVREPGPRLQVHGTCGSFVKYGVDPQEDALAAGRRPGHDVPWGMDSTEQWGLLHAETASGPVRKRIETLPGCYQAYYEDVRDAILHGRPPSVTAEQGRRTIRTIELAVESSAARRTIPWERRIS